MDDLEQAISDEYRTTITRAMTHSDRSQHSAAKKLGISDLGHCREFTRLTIEETPDSDHPHNFQAAFNGTAIGDLVEKHLSHETQGEVTVTIPMRDGYTLRLLGHPDVIRRDDDNKVTGIDDIKGLALDTPIATPAGWTTMGDLEVGDVVFDKDGLPTKVTQVSNVKMIDCHKVTFESGHEIIADSEHRWLSATKGAKWKEMSVVTTADLEGRKVPVAGIVDLPDVDLPEDPWAVGYWLGNGHNEDSMVTCNLDDIDEVAAIARDLGFTA